jgi:regulator of replication initiation timing
MGRWDGNAARIQDTRSVAVAEVEVEYAALREANTQLRDENVALRTENGCLRERVEQLLARVRELERAGKRQAAPFSRNDPKPDPKRPGRKPGADYEGARVT